MKQKIEQKLWKLAVKARKTSYAPYSKFRVGAALVSHGKFWAGANVENVSYGATICAERTAIVHAVVAGLKKPIESICVVTSLGVAPCGMCLQVMAEFCVPETVVYIATPKGIQKALKFKHLFPSPFTHFR